jgi:DNA polymerase-3 subunit delta'
MNNALYPWQQTLWQHLQQSRKRFPHAVLLHGRAGIGKYHFAKQLSQALLCTNVDAEGNACQQCSSCHWFNDDSHPDFRLLSPEQESENDNETESVKKKTKKKNHISIAQVRGLSDFLNLTSHNQHGLRIILIQPAEALNQASANALLKMLEEPANNVVFILVAHQLQRLLPTILSRCHKIAMPMPTEAEAVQWLKAQGVENAQAQLAYYADCPIKVKEDAIFYPSLTEIWRLFAEGQGIEPAVAASKLVAQSAEFGIIAFQKWLYDIASMKSTGQIRYHQTEVNTLHRLASKVNLTALFDLQKKLAALRQLALHPLNHELQLECLLFEYSKLFAK